MRINTNKLTYFNERANNIVSIKELVGAILLIGAYSRSLAQAGPRTAAGGPDRSRKKIDSAAEYDAHDAAFRVNSDRSYLCKILNE